MPFNPLGGWIDLKLRSPDKTSLTENSQAANEDMRQSNYYGSVLYGTARNASEEWDNEFQLLIGQKHP